MSAIALGGALAEDVRPGGALYVRLEAELSTLKSSDRVAMGSTGDDVHVVSRALTIDPGGDDTYRFEIGEAEVFQSRIVIDFEGDDQFEASQLGVAAGVMCLSILIDTRGDDRYRVEEKGIGLGLLGLGVLIDESGNDVYSGGQYSQGVACVGVGLVLDREGNDRYDAGSFSQGVGFPGGCGTLLDSSGDDVYLCTGKQQSPYGDAGEYAGWGQGCGFGFRYLGCGGVGVLIDEDGKDVYRAGQFGLGCGYFFGVGLVNDRDGNDFYECSRYGLGSAAHYGVGLVLDDQGEDAYSAIRSACVAVVGSSWDLSVGVLIDGAGNDIYRGVSYAMGGAAQTSYGFLWDKAGDDVYATSNRSPGAVLGYVGGASYGAGRQADNLSVFLDSAGDDIYSAPGRANQQSGVDNKYGVWIDQ